MLGGVRIRSTLGCCVNNVFNTSVFGSVLEGLQVANGRLWDTCGVNRTYFCPLPTVFDIAETTMVPETDETRVTDKGVVLTASASGVVLMVWMLFAMI